MTNKTQDHSKKQDDSKKQDAKAAEGFLSLAELARGPERWLGVLLLISCGLLIAAWFLPLMTVERFLIFHDTLSLYSASLRLWRYGDYGLFAVILLFTLIFPVLKLALALGLWVLLDVGGAFYLKLLHGVETLGKWSMVDVFIVALSVVAIKISLVSDVVLHAGIYFFAASVLLANFTLWRLRILAEQALKSVRE